MRLISQDGLVDVNYDNGSLVVGFGGYKDCVKAIISYYDNSSQRGTKLAEYSSKDKALKVMEMLREQYEHGKKISFPQLDESGIAKDDDIMLFNTRVINDYFKCGTYISVKVFKFPTDEEVEV